MALPPQLGSSPKKKMPVGIMIAVGTPKKPADEAEPKEEATEPKEKEIGGKKTPEAAFFTNDHQVCATCDHFSGDDGIGSCDLVSADYTQTDPMASQCRYWTNEEKSDTPAEEKQEEVMAQ